MPGLPHEAIWPYSRAVVDKYGDKYKNRPHITRDSRIAGGVYYGTYGGEAIVVDPTKHPKTYLEWFNKAAQRATKNGEIKRNRVMRAVFDTVREQMPYSTQGVERVNSRVAAKRGDPKFVNGTKVDLVAYMNNNVGECRHQALAVAVLMERFIDQGHLRGKVSAERNVDWKPNGDPAGHAWVRYTTYDGEPWILDVAQNYFGSLADSPANARWNYMRPEEQQQFTAQQAGRIALPPQVA